MTDVLGRVGNILRANTDAMVDGAENPKRMLDQLIGDFTNCIAEAEGAAEGAAANLRSAEEDHHGAHDEAEEWGSKARIAAAKASDLEASGSAEEAGRFNDLARSAIRQQIEVEVRAMTLDDAVARESSLNDQLREGIGRLRDKREVLERRRDELTERSRAEEASGQSQSGDDSSHPEESPSAETTPETSWSADEGTQPQKDGTDAEVESRLAALKAGATT